MSGPQYLSGAHRVVALAKKGPVTATSASITVGCTLQIACQALLRAHRLGVLQRKVWDRAWGKPVWLYSAAKGES